MGTDIRMYAEVKQDGFWHLIGDLEENLWFFSEDDPEGYPLKPVEVYDQSNYTLFAVLADVRNLPQFKKSTQYFSQKFECISQPRGLPEDLSLELRNWVSAWDLTENDLGWLYLSEILQFDWHGKIMRYEAMVDPRVAHLFQDDKPFPRDEWPEDVPPPRSLNHQEWEGILVRWSNNYASSVGSYFFEIMNGLKQHGEPSDIRLVFWFT